MIDINLLRNDIDAVAARLATRGFAFDKNEFQVLEEKRKAIQTRTEQLQAQTTRWRSRSARPRRKRTRPARSC